MLFSGEQGSGSFQIDGGKGLRAAVRRAFGKKALVHRCQWHKRENVLEYLSKSERAWWRKRLQAAYERPTCQEAKAALQAIRRDLSGRNLSAVKSLDEGRELGLPGGEADEVGGQEAA